MDQENFQALLLSQRGVFTTEQARGYGVSLSRLHNPERRPSYARLFKGVYLAAFRPPTREERLRAATLWAGPEAVLCGPTAARAHALWGFTDREGWEEPIDADIHLRVPRGGKTHAPEGVVLHRTASPRSDVAFVRGLAVTSVERTLLDLEGQVDRTHLIMAFADAHRRGRTGGLAAMITASRRPCPVLRELIARAEGRPHVGSPVEALVEDVLLRSETLRALGLSPLRQHHVKGRRGKNFYIDLAFVELQVAIEVDGKLWHDLDPAWDKDKLRDNELTLRGWHVTHITAKTALCDPAEVLRLVLAAVSQRKGRGG